MAQAVPHLQNEWEEKVFIQNIVINLRKITEFLNKFGMFSAFSSSFFFLFLIFSLSLFKEISTRYRLAKVNERLTILERQVVYLEAAVNTTQTAAQ
ncbi:MAG: hypothetical protein Q8P67_14070 [archaeon]|nr:hypothetical protein [archaeon]